MHPILQRTIGGLTRSAYIRHFLFGLFFPALILTIGVTQGQGAPISTLIFVALNSILYPYARHAFETGFDYVLGNNVFFTTGRFLIISKLITMTLCWCGAIFIAPAGWLVLYFQTGKNAAAE